MSDHSACRAHLRPGQDPDEKVYRCWLDGRGIRETMLAVRRTTGAHLTFEEVREQFTTLARRFA